jgi:hypothetical protein
MLDCRYSLNQIVKSVLVRHYTDLSQLDFTTVRNIVYLNRILKKDPSGEFTASGLEAMLREIVRIPGVHGLQADLDNWMISYSGAGFELYRKVIQRGGSGAGETVHIGESEYVQEVLEDIAGTDGEDNDRSR